MQAADNDDQTYQRYLPLQVITLRTTLPGAQCGRRATGRTQRRADPGRCHIPAGQTIDGLPFASGGGASGADSSVSPVTAIA